MRHSAKFHIVWKWSLQVFERRCRCCCTYEYSKPAYFLNLKLFHFPWVIWVEFFHCLCLFGESNRSQYPAAGLVINLQSAVAVTSLIWWIAVSTLTYVGTVGRGRRSYHVVPYAQSHNGNLLTRLPTEFDWIDRSVRPSTELVNDRDPRPWPKLYLHRIYCHQPSPERLEWGCGDLFWCLEMCHYGDQHRWCGGQQEESGVQVFEISVNVTLTACIISAVLSYRSL